MNKFIFLVPFIALACSDSISDIESEFDNESELNVDLNHDTFIEEPTLGQLNQPYVGNVGLNTNPLTFWWYATASDQEDDIRAALECALPRWRAATCLPIDISFDSKHWTRLKPSSSVPGGWGYASRQQDGSWRVQVRDDQSRQTTCGLMTHEIGHVLANSGTHTTVYEDVMYYSYHQSNPNVLTQASLDLICAEQDCPCQIPEASP